MKTASQDLFPRGFLRAWTIAVSIFIFGPLVIVGLVSLTATEFVSLPTKGLTLRWYGEVLANENFRNSALNSIVIGLGSAAIATILGLLAALAVVRFSFRLRMAVELIGSSPLFIPMVLGGLGILIFFSDQAWAGPGTRLMIGHIGLTIPYLMRTVTTSLAGFDQNQELAARCLGAHPLTAFFRVTFPQILPGVVAGALFAFIVSFDNVGLSIFLVGPGYSTLPVELFTYASFNNDPGSAAASVGMILLSIGCIILLEKFFGLQQVLKGA